MVEIIGAVLIGALAVVIFVKSVRKKAKTGGCDCGSCSATCPMYNKK